MTSPSDIEKAKEDKINLMFSRGLTVQPYIITVGPSLNNIIQVFLVVNEYIYQCPSVLDALNACFKVHIVLDAKYAFECQHIWYLIQWQIYKYFSSSDPHIAFINDLRT